MAFCVVRFDAFSVIGGGMKWTASLGEEQLVIGAIGAVGFVRRVSECSITALLRLRERLAF